MENESYEAPETSSPRRYRGPEGARDEIAHLFAERAKTSEGIGGVAEESLLKHSFTELRGSLSQAGRLTFLPSCKQTSEREGDGQQSDHRAMEGTFVNVPRESHGNWSESPAHPNAPLIASFHGWRQNEEGLIVLDAKPDNFIKTPEGILPINLLLTEPLLAA